jgi:hypothetical protein
MKRILNKIWSTVTKFKFRATIITTKDIGSVFLKFGIVLVLLFGTLQTSVSMNNSFGTIWGIGTLCIMILISVILFIKFISSTKTIPDLIDGFVALTILFTTIVIVFLAGSMVAKKMASLFNQEIGWVSFALFLLFALFLTFRVGEFTKEEEHDL